MSKNTVLATLAVSSTTTYVPLSSARCLLVMSQLRTCAFRSLIRDLLPLFFPSPVDMIAFGGETHSASCCCRNLRVFPAALWRLASLCHSDICNISD